MNMVTLVLQTHPFLFYPFDITHKKIAMIETPRFYVACRSNGDAHPAWSPRVAFLMMQSLFEARNFFFPQALPQNADTQIK